MQVSDLADAALLVLCGELQVLQAEWQILWSATSDDPKDDTAADRRFDEFCDATWPGYLADPTADPVTHLLTLPATTLDGFQVKAAALRAISDAGGYRGVSRADECGLTAAFLKEVAGRFFMPLGEDAEQESTAVPLAGPGGTASAPNDLA